MSCCGAEPQGEKFCTETERVKEPRNWTRGAQTARCHKTAGVRAQGRLARVVTEWPCARGSARKARDSVSGMAERRSVIVSKG